MGEHWEIFLSVDNGGLLCIGRRNQQLERFVRPKHGVPGWLRALCPPSPGSARCGCLRQSVAHGMTEANGRR
jgi:hypothetical protein